MSSSKPPNMLNNGIFPSKLYFQKIILIHLPPVLLVSMQLRTVVFQAYCRDGRVGYNTTGFIILTQSHLCLLRTM